MSYLVDTCVVSELTRPRPSPAVTAWLGSVDPDSLYVSALTFGELEKGIERLATGSKKTSLRHWAEELRTEWRARSLPVDEVVAIEWGRMLARAETRGKPLPVIDALIAATAIVNGLTVVTRNEADISRTGAAIFDPWQS